MVAAVARKRFLQQSPEVSEFEADVLEGLHDTPKHVPAKYFYDTAGSLLFERITELPEYYPTRCEMKTLRDHAADIAKLIPEGSALVEFGQELVERRGKAVGLAVRSDNRPCRDILVRQL